MQVETVKVEGLRDFAARIESTLKPMVDGTLQVTHTHGVNEGAQWGFLAGFTLVVLVWMCWLTALQLRR